MKIPDKVFIGGLEVKVHWVDDLSTKKDCIGLADLEGAEILLHKDKEEKRSVSDEYMFMAFLHEYLHHVIHTMGVDVKHEDIFVDILSNYLLQFLKQLEAENGKTRT